MELKRLVGQAVFCPVESWEEMDGITQFDALDITFTNVGVAYSVKEEKAVLEDVTVRTNQSQVLVHMFILSLRRTTVHELC